MCRPVLTPYFRVFLQSTSSCSRLSGCSGSSRLKPSSPSFNWCGWWKSSTLELRFIDLLMYASRMFSSSCRKCLVNSSPFSAGRRSKWSTENFQLISTFFVIYSYLNTDEDQRYLSAHIQEQDQAQKRNQESLGFWFLVISHHVERQCCSFNLKRKHHGDVTPIRSTHNPDSRNVWYWTGTIKFP